MHPDDNVPGAWTAKEGKIIFILFDFVFDENDVWIGTHKIRSERETCRDHSRTGANCCAS
jgi:hypothetical protein